ncbi:unnamed protein product [Rhizoctonia solani]|uniref:Uncharacterized protein n=1 Tax=Rhizoctonia solani TaxID=456999 RepID=A0A8H3HGG7_9AGAM|nr:unnamed protein product [Rhizoctonia solani]
MATRPNHPEWTSSSTGGPYINELTYSPKAESPELTSPGSAHSPDAKLTATSSPAKDPVTNPTREPSAVRQRPPSYRRNPNPADTELVAKRFNQWRRFSRDPYKPPLTSSSQPQGEGEELTQRSPRRVRYPGSGWTHLFYDLAWTATFATLAENGEFDEPMDYVSYFVFFAAALWLWASQTLYTVHFYTNDWFHLISIFLQLLIYGGLAATTKGYEITTYISHLPGVDNLNPDPPSNGEEELERFAAERTALLSAQAMALAFALTRFIHLAQYLRAYYYGRWGNGVPERKYVPWGRIIIDVVHPHVYAIVTGLIVSNGIFFAVVGIVFEAFAITKVGASLKLGLWVLGFSVEVFSHLWYPLLCRVGFFRDPTSDELKRVRTITIAQGARADNTAKGKGAADPKHQTANNGIGTNPLPLAGLMLGERLDTVTTIILGEGINKFAGTLTSILTAPGVKRAVAVNVVSAAFIIWFIAYLYFEGPIIESNLDEGLRRLIWMVTYLPFLASIFLLLVGIKNQFILTSTLSMANRAFENFLDLLGRTGFLDDPSNPTYESNSELKRFLFARGMVWSNEYKSLMEGADQLSSQGWLDRVTAWVMRLSLTMIINPYKTISGEDIPEEVQTRLNAYNQNDTLPILDFANINDPSKMEFYAILTELLNGSIEGARYLLIFAAGIPLCLGLQSIIHSPPRALLLLLNLGRYQEFYIAPVLKHERARVFNWLEANWILPTIALAYGVLFIVELVLAYFAKRATLAAKTKAVRDSTATTTLFVAGTGVLEPVENGTVDEKQNEDQYEAEAEANAVAVDPDTGRSEIVEQPVTRDRNNSGRLLSSPGQRSSNPPGDSRVSPPPPMLGRKEEV